jgi:hypothetical protein
MSMIAGPGRSAVPGAWRRTLLTGFGVGDQSGVDRRRAADVGAVLPEVF